MCVYVYIYMCISTISLTFFFRCGENSMAKLPTPLSRLGRGGGTLAQEKAGRELGYVHMHIEGRPNTRERAHNTLQVTRPSHSYNVRMCVSVCVYKYTNILHI